MTHLEVDVYTSRTVPPLPDDVIEDLSAFFDAFGVGFGCRQAGAIADDPTTRAELLQAVDRILPPGDERTPGAKTVLLLATHYADGRDWNGLLLDEYPRGASVVFTQSSQLSLGRPWHLLQSVAHELGHQLNLVHPVGGERSAMTPALARIRRQLARMERLRDRAADAARLLAAASR